LSVSNYHTEAIPLPEPTRERRSLVLAICCLSLFLVGMDATIINVALPAIGRDFRAPVSGLQWTIDAYLLVIASLLMLSGSTGDRLGRRRVFQAGLAVFTLGSLACSLAPGLGWLIAFRALQAVGGSMLNPVAMSIVTNTFTEPAERARAIGLWGSVFGLSIALGPVIGGALVDSVGWRGVFWVNIPVGIAAIALTAVFVPESRAGTYRKPDPVGQALVMAVLVTLTYAIIEGPGRGWSSAPITTCFAVAAAALAAFCWHERRRPQPLVDLRFFRSLPFSGAALTAIAGMGAFAGFLFLITLYLQDVRGYRPLQAGLFLVPMALVMAASAPLAGRMIARHGTRAPLIIAGVGVTLGGVALTFLTATSPPWYVLASCVVLGVGMGWLNAPVTNNAVAGMPRSQAGVASGIASTSRQVGSSLGVAVAGSVLAAGLHGSLPGIATGSLGGGFASAARPGWAIIAGLGAVVLALALITTGQRGRASAQRAAALITRAEQGAAPARAAGNAAGSAA
jgi:EmrB/QacA subfamily drug resistance transporter